jgi:hypothetical protein
LSSDIDFPNAFLLRFHIMVGPPSAGNTGEVLSFPQPAMDGHEPHDGAFSALGGASFLRKVAVRLDWQSGIAQPENYFLDPVTLTGNVLA